MPEYGLDYFDLFSVEVTTGAFTPYEAVIPTITPNTVLYLPPDTGLTQPVPQAQNRKFILRVEPVTGSSC